MVLMTETAETFLAFFPEAVTLPALYSTDYV